MIFTQWSDPEIILLDMRVKHCPAVANIRTKNFIAIEDDRADR